MEQPIYGLLPGDNKTPLTMNWNVTISQALPWRSVFEVSYVGNKSQNEWIDGGNGKVGDQNNVLPGGFFLPDPTGSNTGGANLREAHVPQRAGLHQEHAGGQSAAGVRRPTRTMR